jgi:hypothetical protein
MSTTKRTILTTLMIITAVTAAAQAGPSAFVGVTLPQEAWDDVASVGPHIGVELTVPVVPALLQLGGQASISRNAFDFPDTPAYDDVSATFYTGEVLGIAKLTVPITGVYLKAGLGFNHYRVSGDDIDYDSETHLAGAIGAGWNVMMLDINMMYHVVKWDVESDNPESIDDVNVDYSYFTASVGFGF